MSGKGDTPRPGDGQRYRDEYDRIFARRDGKRQATWDAFCRRWNAHYLDADDGTETQVGEPNDNA